MRAPGEHGEGHGERRKGELTVGDGCCSTRTPATRSLLAVMSLPTTGPMLLSSLRSQDMYLAGSFLMFLAVLTVVGMFISDLLLAALDPRIRLGIKAAR